VRRPCYRLAMAARRSVLVLVGPKGAGKTHVGTLIESELGVRFLRVEPIFLENLRYSRLSGAARDAEGYAKVLAEVDSVLSGEQRVVIESTGASEAFPAFLDELRSRCEVRLVAIRAPLDRCLERVRSRDRADHIPVSDERVAEINARAAAVELPWDLELDNGGSASADAILASSATFSSRRRQGDARSVTALGHRFRGAEMLSPSLQSGVPHDL
jgi:shikimate kinase